MRPLSADWERRPAKFAGFDPLAAAGGAAFVLPFLEGFE
jgi:hypothetical protein